MNPVKRSQLMLLAFAVTAGGAFAVITARPLANPEVLEPSIQNEVDHALALVPSRPAETNLAIVAVQREFAHIYATNGMNATERAISLVSMQKAGEWHWKGTNVTAAAVKLLTGCEALQPFTNLGHPKKGK